jgi:hypothetical protein
LSRNLISSLFRCASGRKFGRADYINGVDVSLIGVFVTVSGIVVGADTAVRQRGTTDFAVASAPKFTGCGQNAYAGLTGITRWIVEDGASNRVYNAIDAVNDTCDGELRRQPDLPLRTLTERIGRALSRHVGANYPSEARALLRTTDEQRLIVAGMENGKPVIYSLSLSLRRNVATAVETVSGCKFLIGETDAAAALTQERAPLASLAQRPEVAAVRTCNNVTADDAKTMFRLAVDVSRDYALDFGLDSGVVNWPIDFGFIDGDGVRPIVRETNPPQR